MKRPGHTNRNCPGFRFDLPLLAYGRKVEPGCWVETGARLGEFAVAHSLRVFTAERVAPIILTTMTYSRWPVYILAAIAVLSALVSLAYLFVLIALSRFSDSAIFDPSNWFLNCMIVGSALVHIIARILSRRYRQGASARAKAALVVRRSKR